MIEAKDLKKGFDHNKTIPNGVNVVMKPGQYNLMHHLEHGLLVNYNVKGRAFEINGSFVCPVVISCIAIFCRLLPVSHIVITP